MIKLLRPPSIGTPMRQVNGTREWRVTYRDGQCVKVDAVDGEGPTVTLHVRTYGDGSRYWSDNDWNPWETFRP